VILFPPCPKRARRLGLLDWRTIQSRRYKEWSKRGLANGCVEGQCGKSLSYAEALTDTCKSEEHFNENTIILVEDVIRLSGNLPDEVGDAAWGDQREGDHLPIDRGEEEDVMQLADVEQQNKWKPVKPGRKNGDKYETP
jgi:hypothetical protein